MREEPDNMEAASVGDGLNNETAVVEENGEVRDLERNCLREPLLLKGHGTLSSSPLAMVGAKVAHIESLDYEMTENDLFKQDWGSQYMILKWKMAFLIGLLTGLIATLINLAVENVSGYKLLLGSNCIQSESYVEGFVYLVGANFMLTLVATVLCVCFAPMAAGPGIPEIKAYLNGIDAPNMYGAPTLIVKADYRKQRSGICGAKSGERWTPDSHQRVHSIPPWPGGSEKYPRKWRWLRYLNNDRDTYYTYIHIYANNACYSWDQIIS